MIYAIPEHQSLASAEEPEGKEGKRQENSKCFIRRLDYELDCTGSTQDDRKQEIGFPQLNFYIYSTH